MNTAWIVWVVKILAVASIVFFGFALPVYKWITKKISPKKDILNITGYLMIFALFMILKKISGERDWIVWCATIVIWFLLSGLAGMLYSAFESSRSSADKGRRPPLRFRLVQWDPTEENGEVVVNKAKREVSNDKEKPCVSVGIRTNRDDSTVVVSSEQITRSEAQHLYDRYCGVEHGEAPDEVIEISDWHGEPISISSI